MPQPTRRLLFRLTALAPAVAVASALAAGGPGTADSEVDTTDLSLFCDTALAYPMRQATAAFRAASGVRVHIFPTAAPLLIPQLLREVQNDIIVTSVAQMEAAAAAGLLTGTAIGPWHSPWVLAARRDVTPAAARAGRIAVVDPTGPLRPDGRAMLPGLGLDPAQAMGVIDTREVAPLLSAGTASAGLLHLCEARADRRLQVLAMPDVPPLRCAAAISVLVRRPKPEAFLRFLASREATVLLAEAGLAA